MFSTHGDIQLSEECLGNDEADKDNFNEQLCVGHE
jgi:hypothetical protein